MMYDDDEPAVVLSAGPAYSRQAGDDDPPYEPPAQRLGFTAPDPQPAYVVWWRESDVNEHGMVHPIAVAELGPRIMPFRAQSPFAVTGCDRALVETGMCRGAHAEVCPCGWEPTIATLRADLGDGDQA